MGTPVSHSSTWPPLFSIPSHGDPQCMIPSRGGPCVQFLHMGTLVSNSLTWRSHVLNSITGCPSGQLPSHVSHLFYDHGPPVLDSSTWTALPHSSSWTPLFSIPSHGVPCARFHHMGTPVYDSITWDRLVHPPASQCASCTIFEIASTI